VTRDDENKGHYNDHYTMNGGDTLRLAFSIILRMFFENKDFKDL